jgi:hypothetical protein
MKLLGAPRHVRTGLGISGALPPICQLPEQGLVYDRFIHGLAEHIITDLYFAGLFAFQIKYF